MAEALRIEDEELQAGGEDADRLVVSTCHRLSAISSLAKHLDLCHGDGFVYRDCLKPLPRLAAIPSNATGRWGTIGEQAKCMHVRLTMVPDKPNTRICAQRQS